MYDTAGASFPFVRLHVEQVTRDFVSFNEFDQNDSRATDFLCSVPVSISNETTTSLFEPLDTPACDDSASSGRLSCLFSQQPPQEDDSCAVAAADEDNDFFDLQFSDPEPVDDSSDVEVWVPTDSSKIHWVREPVFGSSAPNSARKRRFIDDPETFFPPLPLGNNDMSFLCTILKVEGTEALAVGALWDSSYSERNSPAEMPDCTRYLAIEAPTVPVSQNLSTVSGDREPESQGSSADIYHSAHSSTVDMFESQRYYQLGHSSLGESNRVYTAEEKRLAIIEALQRFSVSLMRQVVDAVERLNTRAGRRKTMEDEGTTIPSAPAPTSTPASTPSKRRQATKGIVIELARRHGSGRRRSDGYGSQLPSRKMMFPRKCGRSGKLGIGADKLARFLRVLSIIVGNLIHSTVVTKRDMYYQDVNLFKKQVVVDMIIEDIAASLKVRRKDLNVIASSKGLFAGGVRIILKDGNEVSGHGQGALIPTEQRIQTVEYSTVKWVLIVEKDAVFQSLCHSDFWELMQEQQCGDGILLCGRGYPDVVTREFLKRISYDQPCVPLLGLVDSDPHGIDILLTYKHGSLAMDYDVHNLAVPSVEWIGVKGREWDSINADRKSLLVLNNGDRKKAIAMLKRTEVSEEYRVELSYMLHLHRKAEIQLLSSVSPLAALRQSCDGDPSECTSSPPLPTQDKGHLVNIPRQKRKAPILEYVASKIYHRLLEIQDG